ncbi:MAG: hypothetical protein JWM28_2368, partial [Chitinophagaceae bacterium]|nr:hypothetical protein [Chitinophagaceae bacterium]
MNDKRPVKMNKLISMKKILFYIFFIVIAISSCRKDDNSVFNQSPDERIKETLDKYQSALTGSPAGWNATITTGTGGIYHFYFRFNDSNRVFMYADISLETATVLKESSYRLKAIQQPSLLFDTYSYLHLLSDPSSSVNGGIDGAGLISDFEFSMDTLTADSIRLTGSINSTKVTLIKATQQDLDDWQNGKWANVLAFQNIGKIQNYFKRMNIGGKNYEIRVDLVTRTITFTWIDGSGNLQSFTTGYNYSAGGIDFVTAFDTGTQTINGLEIVSWDASNFILNVKVNGTATTIAGAVQPLKIDLAAPSRWWNYAIDNGGVYWISGKGFHVNGVDDAFGISAIAKYYYLIYWPTYDTSNDLFAPVFINDAGTGLTLQYGAAPNIPQFTGDGRAIFTLLGTYGTYPSSGPPAVTLTQLLIPQGYYFVQTGPTTYDMVSALDAKAWV